MREIIEEAEYHQEMEPARLDTLLSQGWRHFGTLFYRYNLTIMRGEMRQIMALRVDLEEFKASKSQRRVVRKNQDTETRIATASISEEKERMFFRHSERFEDNQPTTLYNFVSEEPGTVPCPCLNIDIHLPEEEGRLLATSFLDVGVEAVSSIYAFFDPDESSRSLGTYTILEEIAHAKALGKRWYYIGYATVGSSVYDYKKTLPALQAYDWEGDRWLPLGEVEKG